MALAQLSAPDAVASLIVGGSARTFTGREDVGLPASGHLSDSFGRSLTRRSRVRRKGSIRDDDSSSDVFSVSDDISSGQLFVKIPLSKGPSSHSPHSGLSLDPSAPRRPERSPNRPSPFSAQQSLLVDENQRGTRQRTLSSGAVSRPVMVEERGRQTCSENGEHRSGPKPRGKSLPRHAFRNGSLSDSSEQPSPLTPLAFNDIPPIPIFARNRRYRHQPQDSGVTQQSSTSSSLYPKSTSTDDSFPSLPSLPSNDIDHRLIINVDPEINPHVGELHEMDADDVSYRLRLLMQNNYYLPPAHSKPFGDYSSLETPKKSPKAPSPTFFDIFKVGKKKSTEKFSLAQAAPILRTTSDSSTLSGLIRPDRPAKPSQHAAAAVTPRQDSKKGRVVVVRERMEDIEAVAKQVEQDLKLREAERRKAASDPPDFEVERDHFVDPTDSVDLPPVSANNFLGPRASLLGGTAFEVGADAGVLADGLQPSSSGIWSVNSEDAAWRKALLHAAVNHSLNASPAVTPARSPATRSPYSSAESSASPPPPMSLLYLPDVTNVHQAPGSQEMNSALSLKRSTSSLSQKRDLGQRIISQMIDEEVDVLNTSVAVPGVTDDANDSGNGRPSASTEESQNPTAAPVGGEIPARASSPTVQTLPLLPPPRRQSAPIISSMPSHDVHEGESVDDHMGSPGLLQAGQANTPLRLSDAYESQIGLSGAFGDPDVRDISATVSAVKAGPYRSMESLTSGSHYSDDDQTNTAFLTPRDHTVASTPQTSRPSLSLMTAYRPSSDYSESSPTSTEFGDAFDHTPIRANSSPSVANTLGGRSPTPSCASGNDRARNAALSPPPRVSSSLAHAILPAPPRRRRTDPLPAAVGEEEEYHTPMGQPQDLVNFAVPGASFIEFFDTVELQHSGVEDGEEDDTEEESVEDESDSDDGRTIESAVSGFQSDSAGMVVVDPLSGSVQNVARDPKQPLGAFARLSTSSTPQLRAGPSDSAVSIVTTRIRSSSNVPQVPYSALPTHSSDVLPRPNTASSRIGERPWKGNKEERSVRAWQEDQDRQDQSVRRLDGMLIEHMEREKEVLRRITTTMSKNS